jgi:hypothetical protein
MLDFSMRDGKDRGIANDDVLGPGGSGKQCGGEEQCGDELRAVTAEYTKLGMP